MRGEGRYEESVDRCCLERGQGVSRRLYGAFGQDIRLEVRLREKQRLSHETTLRSIGKARAMWVPPSIVSTWAEKKCVTENTPKSFFAHF